MPREDVQTIMASLGGRTAEGRELEQSDDFVIDLQGADLRYVWSLTNARFERARLSGAKLKRVKGVTQEQLDQAEAGPNDPPDLAETNDSRTGLSSTWSKPPEFRRIGIAFAKMRSRKLSACLGGGGESDHTPHAASGSRNA